MADAPDGTGKIGDVVAPVEQAVIAAAQADLQFSPGDARVCAALRLGWLAADIVAPRTPVPFPDDLLTPGTIRRSQGTELSTLFATLAVSDAPAPEAVKNALAAGQPAAAELRKWQPDFVAVMLGSDISLARAYALGRDLNNVAYGDGDPLRSSASAILARLDDLSSLLPSHAARAVAISVGRWQAADRRPPDRLEAQCELWRTILTGEKRCTELLEPENYIDAAERLATKLRAAVTSVLRQYAFWTALIAVLFLGGAAILLFVPSTATETAAGLTGVLAAFGLTWKGVGTTLGKLAARLEAPLWGGELDGAVADAVTLLPHAAQPGRGPLTAGLLRMSRHETSIAVRRARKGGDYADRAVWRVAARSDTSPAAGTPAAGGAPGNGAARASDS